MIAEISFRQPPAKVVMIAEVLLYLIFIAECTRLWVDLDWWDRV